MAACKLQLSELGATPVSVKKHSSGEERRYIYIYIERERERETLGGVSLKNTQPWDGEQFLLLDCRAEARMKGRLFCSQTPVAMVLAMALAVSHATFSDMVMCRMCGLANHLPKHRSFQAVTGVQILQETKGKLPASPVKLLDVLLLRHTALVTC